MIRSLLLLFVILTAPLAAQAPASPQNMFAGAKYDGGDVGSKQKPGPIGWLVLGDSAIEFHPAEGNAFIRQSATGRLSAKTTMRIPYRAITDLVGATERHGASVGSKILFGALAGERRDEMVTIAYEDSTGAEAPVFETQEHDSARFLAQLRFHLKALGLPTYMPATDAPGTVVNEGGK